MLLLTHILQLYIPVAVKISCYVVFVGLVALDVASISSKSQRLDSKTEYKTNECNLIREKDNSFTTLRLHKPEKGRPRYEPLENENEDSARDEEM